MQAKDVLFDGLRVIFAQPETVELMKSNSGGVHQQFAQHAACGGRAGGTAGLDWGLKTRGQGTVATGARPAQTSLSVGVSL
jgi:hypothetical protein